MNADERRSAINEKTEKIIGASFQVSNTLGCGFLEKVYENALAHELRKSGFQIQQQATIKVKYDGLIVGEYIADLIVDEEIIVEVKAVKCFDEIHMAQCLNYLKATGMSICLLMNFGTPKAEVKRIVNKL